MDTDTRRRLLDGELWRQYVVDEAKTWLGTPYQHKGRVKGIGCDCGGIVYQIYNPLIGPFKPFPKDYAQDWSVHRDDDVYMDFILPYVTEVQKPFLGGLAMFKIGRNFCHAAIITGRNKYLHAWGRTQHGCVTETGKDFFRMGNGGKLREVKYFDVKKT